MIRTAFATLFLVASFGQLIAQAQIPTINATSEKASTREGEEFRNDNWTITPSAKPDIWGVVVPKGTKVRCSLITDIDSITFDVERGKSYDFIVILNGKDSAHTRISGTSEPVYFSPQYQMENNNKTIIEIPKVYELTNIIISLTQTGILDSNLVEHGSPYYQDVMKWFGKYATEPVVLQIDSVIETEWWMYFYLKMDAYAYEFVGNEIRKGETYDRLNFDGASNTLEPFITQVEDFAIKTDFLTFYNAHSGLYNDQISYYKDSVDVTRMQEWLNRNFPSTTYNCFKVIFSPLVGGSQSAKIFESNNFKEAQAHINFPYADESDKDYSAVANNMRNSYILFTELNHAYINPETEQYAESEDLQTAFADLTLWETEDSPASIGYANALACFNEYMNWSLASLYSIDFLPITEQETLIGRLEKNMQHGRGFSKFPEFNRELMRLYQSRTEGQTIADLYPAIISWCKVQVE